MKDEYKEMVCRVRFINGVPANVYLSDIEIVRCEDCKFYKEPTMNEVTECWYMEAGGYPNPTDYCRWAERKEE